MKRHVERARDRHGSRRVGGSQTSLYDNSLVGSNLAGEWAGRGDAVELAVTGGAVARAIKTATHNTLGASEGKTPHREAW
jgi:hypothetical protein